MCSPFSEDDCVYIVIPVRKKVKRELTIIKRDDTINLGENNKKDVTDERQRSRKKNGFIRRESSAFPIFAKVKYTDRVCKLIFENADVIKGIFCGHHHSAFCTSVYATYCDESGVHSAKIPQIVAPGNPYLGHCGIVTRIIIN